MGTIRLIYMKNSNYSYCLTTFVEKRNTMPVAKWLSIKYKLDIWLHCQQSIVATNATLSPVQLGLLRVRARGVKSVEGEAELSINNKFIRAQSPAHSLKLGRMVWVRGKICIVRTCFTTASTTNVYIRKNCF